MARRMKEYKIIQAPIDSAEAEMKVNDLARQGWEIFSVSIIPLIVRLPEVHITLVREQ